MACVGATGEGKVMRDVEMFDHVLQLLCAVVRGYSKNISFTVKPTEEGFEVGRRNRITGQGPGVHLPDHGLEVRGRVFAQNSFPQADDIPDRTHAEDGIGFECIGDAIITSLSQQLVGELGAAGGIRETNRRVRPVRKPHRIRFHKGTILVEQNALDRAPIHHSCIRIVPGDARRENHPVIARLTRRRSFRGTNCVSTNIVFAGRTRPPDNSWPHRAWSNVQNRSTA